MHTTYSKSSSNHTPRTAGLRCGPRGARLATALILLSGAIQAAWAQTPTPGPPASPPQSAPASQPSSPRGVLAVRAVQGTKGSFAIGGADVEIDIVAGNRSVQHFAAKMDDQGLVMIGDVPLGDGFRPVVRIKYSGVTYQEVGPVMNAGAPNASMPITVFETTEEAPPWRVSMRHVIATPGPGGFDIAETIVVENPSDRTWIGGAADAAGKRPVVQVSLPDNAQAVELDEGFHGWCCTTLIGREMTVQMPLMPGSSTFKYSYRVPVIQRAMDLRLASPVPVDHAVFFVPEDVSDVQTEGVLGGDVQTMGQFRMRMFSAAGIKPGATVGVILKTGGSPQASAGGSWQWIMPFAGGVGLMLVIGIVLYIRRVRGGARGHAPRRIST